MVKLIKVWLKLVAFKLDLNLAKTNAVAIIQFQVIKTLKKYNSKFQRSILI